jgi:competence protein ComEC
VWCAFGAALAYYGLAGLFAAGCPPVLILFLLLPAALPALCKVRGRRRFYALACAVFYAGGIIFGAAARRGADTAALVFPGQSVEKVNAVTGILLDDPRSSRSGQGLASLALEYTYGGGKGGITVRASARGSLLVLFPEEALPHLKDFGRGSRITIDGKFLPPQKAGQKMLYKAKSVHILRAPGKVNRLRTSIRLSLLDFFGEKWGGLSMALLLGIRDNLDSNLAAQYTKAGCAYILALSGMHLAIISAAIAFLLKKPLGLKGAAAAGAVIIVLYVYIVGAQASLCRAAIMYLLGAAAVIFALPATPLLLLAFSFLIQLAIAPASGDSISFILSYLALAGILIWTEHIVCIFRGLVPEFLLSPLAVSISAFLATMPVCILFFGELRMAGIAAGLAMVPLTAFFMLGSMMYLVLGLIPLLKTFASFVLGSLYFILDRLSFFAAKAPPLALPPAPLTLFFSIAVPLLFLAAGIYAAKKRAVV